MRNFVKILILATVIGSCTKAPDKAIRTDRKIVGRLFLLDTLTQTVLNTPMVKKKVTIRDADSKDTVNYLYSTTTGDDGYFTFSNLIEGKKYIINYNETVGGIVYTAQAASAAPSQSLALYASIDVSRQKGLIFKVRDYTGNILKDASVCVFTSATNVGYVNKSCEGSSSQLKTDPAGHAFVFGLQNARYYTVSTATVNGMPLLSRDVSDVAGAVKTVEIVLKKPNGIHIETVDANQQIIGNVNICVFTSSILFEKENCDGSNFQLATNSSGQVDKYNLDNNTYYLYARKIVGKDTLVAKSTITVNDIITSVRQVLIKK